MSLNSDEENARKKSKMTKSDDNENDIANIFTCPVCPFQDQDPDILQVHVEKHFSCGKEEVLDQGASNISSISCPFCDKNFPGAKEAEKHVNQVHADIKSTDILSKHINSHVEKQYSPGKLDSLDQGASNISSISCPFCDKNFPGAKEAEKHVNQVHVDGTKDDLQNPKNDIKSSDILSEHINSHVEKQISSRKLDGLHPGASNASSILCPFCDKNFAEAKEAEKHINQVHVDGTKDDLRCPVCSKNDFKSSDILSKHVNSHFVVAGSKEEVSLDRDAILAQELERKERERMKYQESKEFEKLQQMYGMDGRGSFKQQTSSNLEKKAARGEISVVDFHQRRIELGVTEKTGIDNGRSASKNLVPILKEMSMATANVKNSYFCSNLDHFASAEGDKGWGCGYRNLQMLLSSLTKKEPFASHLASRHFPPNSVAPSISRLQELIEKAWEDGFDVAGKEQLGGKLKNTRKWIGATEIAALFGYLRIDCRVVDFHRATADDGTHPVLFQWVLNHFQDSTNNLKSPLYFQHQGHSRTIVGIEELKNGQLRLLIYDPSCKTMFKLSKGDKESRNQVLRNMRKSKAQVTHGQYQIVSVSGILPESQVTSEKVIRSIRIP